MAQQTIQLPASIYSLWFGLRPSWTFLSNTRPVINDSLTDGSNRFFGNVSVNFGGVVGYVSVAIASNQTESSGQGGDDLSSLFETAGGFDLTVGIYSLSVNLAGADTAERYSWFPDNSAEVEQFVTNIIALGEDQAATLVLRDFPSFNADAEAITWTFNVGSATGSTVAVAPSFDGNAEPITWTFNVGSATGATLAAIPAPTLLQPSSNQVGAIGTTTEYFVTFQYDDNSSFTSPSTVYDTVKSSSHSASWTPPSGFTYIRARFTTLIRDGGTRGAWSDTITYGTAPSFDGDAEAITWSFNVGEATGSTVAPVPNEFSGNAEPITWTFNVGSATGSTIAPSFDADAEPITWTFNVGEATGSTTAPTVQLQLDDLDDTGIVTYVKMLVTSGIAESSGTVYKNNGSLGVLESGSDATLATGNDISRIALNIDGNLGDMRFWANPNFFTDKPNALVRMQFAPAGPIYEFSFLNHGSNYSNFRNVAATSALTAAQTAGERFLLVVYQFPEFDADAEPITWTFNVGSATGDATIPEFTADAEPITWSFNVGTATGEATEPVPNEFTGNAEPITWTFNVGDATGSATIPEFDGNAEPITWSFNVGEATGSSTVPEFDGNAEPITWTFNVGSATGATTGPSRNIALPSERAILDARALTGVDQIYALEISHPALSNSIKIVGDIIEHQIESNTYLPLMFQAEIPQSKEGEIRQATIKIDNIGYELMQWVNDTQGGRDAVIRAMMIVSPEGTETQSTVIWEVTMNCGVTEITNEYVIVTLTDEPVFDRPSVLLRHDPSVSPGLF